MRDLEYFEASHCDKNNWLAWSLRNQVDEIADLIDPTARDDLGKTIYVEYF